MIKRLCLILVVVTAAAAATWSFSPDFQEKILLLGLASGSTPLQEIAAERLADYPTKTTAIALVGFANLTAPSTAQISHFESEISKLRAVNEDPARADADKQSDRGKLQELEAKLKLEQQAYEATFPARHKLANAAVKSLCLLSGHSFGSGYEIKEHGYSWSNVDKKEWGSSLSQINGWAMDSFGADVFAAVGGAALLEKLGSGALAPGQMKITVTVGGKSVEQTINTDEN